MIRIRAGRSWKHNPEYIRELRSLGAERARRFSPDSILDVLGLEIDGVDVAAGLREESIFPAVQRLVSRLGALATGRRKRIGVALGDGPVELCVARAGDRALVSLVSLGRPARVLARDVEVPLAALLGAARRCAEEVLRDLRSVNPFLLESRWARNLAAGARKLARAEARRAARVEPQGAAARAPTRKPRAKASLEGPSCGFDLSEDTPLTAYQGGEADLGSLLALGHVQLRAGGTLLASQKGVPFLILRDLSREAERLLAAWEAGDTEHRFCFGDGGPYLTVDLRAGTLTLEGRPAPVRCEPLALARALFSAALDFAGAAAAHNPRQRENGYLRDLATAAAEGLAHARDLAEGDRVRTEPLKSAGQAPRRRVEPPLGPGRLRRLRHRESWRFEAGSVLPGGLRMLSGKLVVLGARGAFGLDPRTGEAAWRLLPPARPAAVSLPDREGPILCAQADGLLRAIHAGSGEVLWERRSRAAQAGVLGRRHLVVDASGRSVLVCLAEGRVVAAFDAESGKSAWRFSPPAATLAHIEAHAGVVLVAADNGFLYALEAATGELAWRLRTGGPSMGRPSIAGGLVAVVARRAGGPALLAAQLATGRPTCDRPLEMDEAGPAAGGSNRVFVAGATPYGLRVEAYTAHGAQAFSAPLGPVRGPAALTPFMGGVLAAQTDGGLCRVDALGQVLWKNTPERPGEHHRPVPPRVRRGVVAAPGDPARLVDAESGATLGLLPSATQIELTDDLSVVLADDEGPVLCWTLATHLSVVG